MLTDTSNSPFARMTAMPGRSTTISGTGPLAVLRERAVEVTIPTMGEIMFDASIAHAYENFLVASGDAEGDHHGPPFMDGDLYKWLEGAAVIAAETDDPQLINSLKLAAEAVDRAQRPDGYIQTKTIIAQRDDPAVQPMADRLDFETYNVGHLMTLACLHHRLTGERSFLDLAIRAADNLIMVAEQDPALLADCNICPSHYMGVVELYRTTRQRRFLDLALRLLDLHGDKGPDGTDDNQDVLPVRDQRAAVGHSVRANYLFAGMADVALETGDAEMITALDSIWNDLTSTKLYLTGGCGALYDGASPDAGQDYWSVTKVHQSYGRPYQLPQTTAYNESCASLGLVMWAWRMLLRTGQSRYADEIERVLHNALPAMIGADGKSYLYTNPLRQVRELPFPLRRPGDPASTEIPPSDHRSRQEYMTACFCCPPNVSRFITELPYYTYTRSATDLWVHQFVSGGTTTTFDDVPVTIEQQTQFPADGTVIVTVEADQPVTGTVRIRVPGWADDIAVSVAGEPVTDVADGYVVINRTWHRDEIRVELPLRTKLVVAHHFLEEAAGQVAVTRGPVVYCLESADLESDVGIESVHLPQTVAWREEAGDGIFTGHVLLRGTAQVLPRPVPHGELYRELEDTRPTPLPIRLVPYALWGNRGPGEMSVWIPLLRTTLDPKLDANQERTA